jgi:hypothetical protein
MVLAVEGGKKKVLLAMRSVSWILPAAAVKGRPSVKSRVRKRFIVSLFIVPERRILS